MNWRSYPVTREPRIVSSGRSLDARLVVADQVHAVDAPAAVRLPFHQILGDVAEPVRADQKDVLHRSGGRVQQRPEGQRAWAIDRLVQSHHHGHELADAWEPRLDARRGV